jgi:hemolysin D
VLEVQLTPPSPIGRATTWTVLALLAAAVAWAALSRVDVVAVARGKVIPSGHSKLVQPLDSGIVRAIRVREGQAVQKGHAVELDGTASEADRADSPTSTTPSWTVPPVRSLPDAAARGRGVDSGCRLQERGC